MSNVNVICETCTLFYTLLKLFDSLCNVINSFQKMNLFCNIQIKHYCKHINDTFFKENFRGKF